MPGSPREWASAGPAGAVAQLGERRNRTAEVRGSNPLGSTKLAKCFLGFAATPPTMKSAETSVWHNAVTASVWLLFGDGDALGRFRFDARDYRYLRAPSSADQAQSCGHDSAKQK